MELIPQRATDTYRSSPKTWQPVRPEDAGKLSDCRLQLHYAAQFGAAAGISFLEHRPDDSHTNLEWVPALRGLFSRVIPAARRSFLIGARPSKLALMIVAEDNQPIEEYKLHGRTITDATEWIRSQIESLSVDLFFFKQKTAYEIPTHDVAFGESFDASAPL